MWRRRFVNARPARQELPKGVCLLSFCWVLQGDNPIPPLIGTCEAILEPEKIAHPPRSQNLHLPNASELLLNPLDHQPRAEWVSSTSVAWIVCGRQEPRRRAADYAAQECCQAIHRRRVTPAPNLPAAPGVFAPWAGGACPEAGCPAISATARTAAVVPSIACAIRLASVPFQTGRPVRSTGASVGLWKLARGPGLRHLSARTVLRRALGVEAVAHQAGGFPNRCGPSTCSINCSNNFQKHPCHA